MEVSSLAGFSTREVNWGCYMKEQRKTDKFTAGETSRQRCGA